MSKPGTPSPSEREKLTSLLLNEDPELRDIVTEFVNGLEKRVAELRDAFTALDWQELKTLAHRLKGAGGSYGYPDVSRLGALMEEQFKSYQVDGFAQWMRELEELSAACKAGLGPS